MPRVSDEEKRKVFAALHDPSRLVHQIAHSKKKNNSEDYDSKKVKETPERMIDRQMELAKNAIQHFRKDSGT